MKNTLLLPALAAALVLSGCAATTSAPVTPEEANKLTPEFQYHKNLSRANNIAIEFSIKQIPDTPAPKEKRMLSDGSVLVDAGIMGALHHNMSGNGFMSSTASWNLGVGMMIAGWLFTPSVEPTDDSLVGYIRAEEAEDVVEAGNLLVKRSAQAFADAFRKLDQFKDYRIDVHYDESWSGHVNAHIEVVNEELGCKPWKDVLMNIYGCGLEISNIAQWAFKPQISTPRFTTPQIQVYYIQGNEIKLEFHNGGTRTKFDWAKAMMATAPTMPEYAYAYINTHEGPAPEKFRNPPFIVEKDKVNFFIIPKIYDMEDPMSEEEREAVRNRMKADKKMQFHQL